MKFPLLIGAAAVGLALTLAVPEFDGARDHRSAPGSPADATNIAPGSVAWLPLRLRVEAGPETAVDRGHLAGLDNATVFQGAFRYQQEGEHRMLYVYDDVQNLVARIVDPASVSLLHAEP